MKTTHLTVSKCPTCGRKLYACDALAEPSPGDLSVCFVCGNFLEFDDELGLKLLPDEKLFDLPDTARLDLVRVRKLIMER